MKKLAVYIACMTALLLCLCVDVSADEPTFQWPEGSDTMEITSPESYYKQDVTIPAGKTLIISSNGRLTARSLTVYGTVRSHDQMLDFDSVVIEDGGVIENNYNYKTVYIREDSIWTVKAGGILAAKVRLDGTLSGEGGTVEGNITVRPGFMSNNADATMSGELTLNGALSIETSGDNEWSAQLTITEGSVIRFSDKGYLRIEPNNEQICLLNLQGELVLTNTYNTLGGDIVLSKTGILTLAADSGTGVLRTNVNEEWVTKTGKITGMGTIRAYCEGDFSKMPRIVSYPVNDDVVRAYVDAGVTIWGDWVGYVLMGSPWYDAGEIEISIRNYSDRFPLVCCASYDSEGRFTSIAWKPVTFSGMGFLRFAVGDANLLRVFVLQGENGGANTDTTSVPVCRSVAWSIDNL